MSQPDPRFITVPHSKEDVAALLQDLFVTPRTLIRKWAEITGQTAQARLAYPGQHLASVVSGVSGMGTAARGEDLIDSSEVKSCSKADQLGQCKACATRVPAWMSSCPNCQSENLTRKDDSHWIISIRRDEEIAQLLDARRLVLVMFDRTAESLSDIRVRIWEVWPSDERHAYARDFFADYYENNYKAKRAAGLEPAPCNLHPLKFDHLMMNPLLVLDAAVISPDSPDAEVRIDFLHPAAEDRADLDPEPMPVRACKQTELEALVDVIPLDEFGLCLKDGRSIEDVDSALRSGNSVKELDGVLSGIPASVRRRFKMREKRIKQTPSVYKRRRGGGP